MVKASELPIGEIVLQLANDVYGCEYVYVGVRMNEGRTFGSRLHCIVEMRENRMRTANVFVDVVEGFGVLDSVRVWCKRGEEIFDCTYG